MELFKVIKVDRRYPVGYHLEDLKKDKVTGLFYENELQHTKETIDHPRIVEEKIVRFRTVGDISCTGAIESTANSLEDIIDEVASTRTTERGLRMDDKRSEAAMEDRKKQGYF